MKNDITGALDSIHCAQIIEILELPTFIFDGFHFKIETKSAILFQSYSLCTNHKTSARYDNTEKECHGATLRRPRQGSRCRHWRCRTCCDKSARLQVALLAERRRDIWDSLRMRVTLNVWSTDAIWLLNLICDKCMYVGDDVCVCSMFHVPAMMGEKLAARMQNTQRCYFQRDGIHTK